MDMMISITYNCYGHVQSLNCTIKKQLRGIKIVNKSLRQTSSG